MSFRRLGFLLVWLCAGSALAAEPTTTGLQTPTKVMAGGKAIDVPAAAPFLGDFKGDGSQSLLVGGGDGKLRIYANQATGSAAGLRFENFTWFLDGKPEGTVPASADVGFTPQLVANGNRSDLFTGSAPGELHVFHGKEKGGYTAGATLKDKAGKAIRVAGGSTVFAFDWRATGKLDLLVGSVDGFVYLIPNNGTDKKDEYGAAQKLEADGKAIKVSQGHSHPIAAEWDKDGKPGLIVGTGAGSVLWFPNSGSRTEPKLAAAQTLVAESALAANKNATLKDGQWGLHAKVCAVDWNGDGWLDLLVGDSALDPAAEKKLQADLAKLEKDQAKAQEKMRALEKPPPAKETAKAKQEREKEMQDLKKLTTKIQQEQADAQKQQAKAGHGHVWLFLRKPNKSTGNN